MGALRTGGAPGEFLRGAPPDNVRLPVHTDAAIGGRIAGMGHRVLIVDDDSRFCGLLRQLLDGSGEFDVVGEAREGQEGVDAASDLAPDVVLLDVNLPDATGFDLVPRFTGDARVVMISSRDDAGYEQMANEAGAAGFVSKHDLSPSALRDLLDTPG